jgi:hypothetical protein
MDEGSADANTGDVEMSDADSDIKMKAFDAEWHAS